MSEQAGGAQTETIDQTTDETTKEVKSINPSDHEKAINDLMKYKKASKAAMDELSQLKAELSKLKEGQALSQNNFKELYETTRQNLEIVQQEKTKLLTSLETTKKYDAVKEHALRSGLRSEAIDDLDRLELDAIEVERTDKGRIVVHGADLYVETLKKSKPHWFESKKTPGFNSGGTQSMTTTGQITVQNVIDAESKASRTRKPEDVEAYKRIRAEYIKNRK